MMVALYCCFLYVVRVVVVSCSIFFRVLFLSDNI